VGETNLWIISANDRNAIAFVDVIHVTEDTCRSRRACKDLIIRITLVFEGNIGFIAMCLDAVRKEHSHALSKGQVSVEENSLSEIAITDWVDWQV
jgi:hypothetical protein